MIIAVRWAECGWTGHAVVGEGFSKRDYKCPRCSYGSLRRPRRGVPAGRIAKLKGEL